MPRNPDKTPCSTPDCRGWALRGSSPPLCSAHSHCVGAPAGNQNRLVHGVYATPLQSEIQDLIAHDAGSDLSAEIAVARAALRQLAGILLSGVTPGPNPRPLTVAEHARYTELSFMGASTVARLVRARDSLSSTDLSFLERDFFRLPR